jgi:prevent-host-death family protein
MANRDVKRLPATEVKTHFGRIVQEVSTTGTPVIIQTRGEDQAVLINLNDFQALWPAEKAAPATVRQRVRTALRKANLLSEPTAQEVAEARAFKTEHSPTDQEHILTTWRRLKLDPPLSDIILRNRERELD